MAVTIGGATPLFGGQLLGLREEVTPGIWPAPNGKSAARKPKPNQLRNQLAHLRPISGLHWRMWPDASLILTA